MPSLKLYIAVISKIHLLFGFIRRTKWVSLDLCIFQLHGIYTKKAQVVGLWDAECHWKQVVDMPSLKFYIAVFSKIHLLFGFIRRTKWVSLDLCIFHLYGIYTKKTQVVGL